VETGQRGEYNYERELEFIIYQGMDEQQIIIIYRTADGRASVALYAKDGKIWLNQQQMAELFATSKQTISYHIINILKEKELKEISVVKEYLTTPTLSCSFVPLPISFPII
jgi:hypothetical protein